MSALDLKSINRRSEEKIFVGTRLRKPTKAKLAAVCKSAGISVHAYLEALIEKDLAERKTK